MSCPKVFLVIHNVTKTYPGVIALNDISMNLRAGVASACRGKRRGKSTIIKSYFRRSAARLRLHQIRRAGTDRHGP